MKLIKRKTLVSSKRPPTENQNLSLKQYVNLYSEYLSFLSNSQLTDPQYN
jgi:hypothetical protein